MTNQSLNAENKKSGDSRRWLSEGLLLAGLTALSYAVTFAYEAGYSTYFGIPKQLIAVNLTTMLIAAGSLLGAMVMVYSIANFLWMLSPKQDDLVSFVVRRYIKIVIICFIAVLPLIRHWQAWLTFLAVILVIAFFEFVFPLITQRKKSTYAEKLREQENIEQRVKVHLLWHVIDLKYGRWLVTTLVYVYIGITFAYNFGRQYAESREEFFVAVNQNNSVILAIYDDTLVTAEVNHETKSLIGPISVTKLDNIKNLVIMKERVGPLLAGKD